MIRTFQRCRIAIALVLSMILALSVTPQTQSKTVHMKLLQLPQLDCSIDASPPSQDTSSQSIEASGGIDCGNVEQILVTVQLQQFTNGQWINLAENSYIGSDAFSNRVGTSVKAACSIKEKMRYRTSVTGQYKTGSGWHNLGFPSHKESDALIACE